MTSEELRTAQIKGIDATLDAPWIVQKFIGADQRRLLRANRDFWMHADSATVDLLRHYHDLQPRREETPKAMYWLFLGLGVMESKRLVADAMPPHQALEAAKELAEMWGCKVTVELVEEAP